MNSRRRRGSERWQCRGYVNSPAAARKRIRASVYKKFLIFLAGCRAAKDLPWSRWQTPRARNDTPLFIDWAKRRDAILDALYGGGDTLMGAAELADMEGTLRALRGFDRPEMRNCMAVLFAMDGVQRHTSDAPARLDSLDAALRTADRPDNDNFYPNIALARMWVAVGEPRKAFVAIRRRPHNHWEGPWFLREFLKIEERLAIGAGDRADAVNVRRHLAVLK